MVSQRIEAAATKSQKLVACDYDIAMVATSEHLFENFVNYRVRKLGVVKWVWPVKIKKPLNQGLGKEFGGGGEIRTHERITPSPVFKTGAFNRSATPPLDSPHYAIRCARRQTENAVAQIQASLRRPLKGNKSKSVRKTFATSGCCER